ncbi:prepilin-type N-terminal cleavage/methylation domain-containing protein [Rhodomicrobium lacus]|uniref:prepilin-type N-terminal cleavage/methylation domain-containing protein n=1 Tax=Rhodomicrobium lacus TaxID=2498452 RepID=UPI0013DF4014|nr:prepilin-type N-terminal cleavage/methylation domain-containing protein [Rhodomicrobium lacus]
MKGYTLVELLIVVAIMAFMTAIGASYFGGRDKQLSLRAVVQDLTLCFRRAHAKAILGNSSRVVVLDIEARQFTSDVCGYGQFSSATRILFRTAAAEHVDRAIAQVHFYGDGTASGGHIFLEERGQVWSIQINWLSGEVRSSREKHWPLLQ